MHVLYRRMTDNGKTATIKENTNNYEVPAECDEPVNTQYTDSNGETTTA